MICLCQKKGNIKHDIAQPSRTDLKTSESETNAHKSHLRGLFSGKPAAETHPEAERNLSRNARLHQTVGTKKAPNTPQRWRSSSVLWCHRQVLSCKRSPLVTAFQAGLPKKGVTKIKDTRKARRCIEACCAEHSYPVTFSPFAAGNLGAAATRDLT